MDFFTDILFLFGFVNIFVCIDYLAKYTKLIPCFMGEEHLIAV